MDWYENYCRLSLLIVVVDVETVFFFTVAIVDKLKRASVLSCASIAPSEKIQKNPMQTRNAIIY